MKGCPETQIPRNPEYSVMPLLQMNKNHKQTGVKLTANSLFVLEVPLWSACG